MINQFWTERPIRRALVSALLITAMTSSQLAWADVTLNFANADIDQIARAIGAATGKTIIVDPRVKGQLSLQSEKPVSDEQALKTLQAALRMQGFSLLQDHGVLKVVPEADAKLQGVPTFVGNQPQARGDQVITQVFQLRNESANNLLPVLRPIISPNNTIAAYPSNNTIVVTDYADNVRRIASIIAGIDTVSGSDIEVVPLNNANALDIAQLAQKLLDPGSLGSTDATLKVNISADARTNAVIVRATNSVRMKMALNLIKKLDAPTRESGNMHVVSLQNADAAQLAKTLRSMLGQSGSSASGSSAKANGSSLFGASGASASGGLSNSNGSLPPLPSGTDSSSSYGSSSSSSMGGSSGGKLGGNSGSSSDDDDSSGGMITADTATNSLIITASEPVYRNLRAVIDKLDHRRVQVYIESLIMEVSSDKEGSFGVQWQGGVSSSNGNNAIVGNSNFATSTSQGIFNLTAAGLAATTTNTTLASGLGNLAGSTLSSGLNNGLNIGFLHRFGSILGLGGLLQAVQTNSDVNILSTPNLITLDNQEARILVGTNIPLSTGSIGTATASTSGIATYSTFDRKDVGIMLNVRPQISAGGTIKLQVYQEDSSVDATTANQAGGYNINKRSVQSTILADDGEIVVLGGLIKDSYSNANSKIPWLGNIPILGALFRSESKSRVKTNLMIFLRPVIIRDADTLNAVSMNRYDYMRSEAANYKTDNRVIRDKDIPVPPPVDPRNATGDVNGLFDWQRRQRNVDAPPLNATVQDQPPYTQDPGMPLPEPAPAPADVATPRREQQQPVPVTVVPVQPQYYQKAQLPGQEAVIGGARP